MAIIFRAPYIAPQYTLEWRVDSSYGTPPVMLQLLLAQHLPPGAQLFDRPPDPLIYDPAAIHWQSWLIEAVVFVPVLPPGAQLFDRPLSLPM